MRVLGCELVKPGDLDATRLIVQVVHLNDCIGARQDITQDTLDLEPKLEQNWIVANATISAQGSQSLKCSSNKLYMYVCVSPTPSMQPGGSSSSE